MQNLLAPSWCGSRKRALDHGVTVSLDALATAVPPHRHSQDQVQQLARDVFAQRTPIFDALEPVYANAQIGFRHTCQPLDWFTRPADFGEKTRAYARHALALAEDAAEKALTEAGLRADQIDAVVSVSSTGIATPSLEARLANRLGFRADMRRLPIFGLGCAGGVLGLSRAVALARERPGTRVLLVVVELCSLAFRFDRLTKSNLVATAIFSDGAAAAVLSSGSGSGSAPTAAVRLGGSGEHLWPDTLNVMGWDVDAGGFDVIFHRKIPELVQTDYGPALEQFLASKNLTHGDIDAFCSHPGGPKVLDELERVYGLDPGGMVAERKVLHDFGNMSAPTAFFVLSELLASGTHGTVLMSALGPGFTAAFQLLHVAAA